MTRLGFFVVLVALGAGPATQPTISDLQAVIRVQERQIAKQKDDLADAREEIKQLKARVAEIPKAQQAAKTMESPATRPASVELSAVFQILDSIPDSMQQHGDSPLSIPAQDRLNDWLSKNYSGKDISLVVKFAGIERSPTGNQDSYKILYGGSHLKFDSTTKIERNRKSVGVIIDDDCVIDKEAIRKFEGLVAGELIVLSGKIRYVIISDHTIDLSISNAHIQPTNHGG